MDLVVFAAVLFSAVCHAAWNTLVKGWSDDRLTATALMFMWIALFALPFLFFVEAPSAELWPYLAAALVFHTLNKVTLLTAYRLAEMSLVYPIARGGAPLLVTLVAALLFGEVPDGLSLVGIAVVAIAIMSLGVLGGAQAGRHQVRGAAVALLVAVSIAGYTLIDGAGARLADNFLTFIMWLFALDGVVLPTYCLLRSPAAFGRALRRSWQITLCAGALAFTGFLAAVWALTQAPMGPVAALRETSVVFGALLATLVLKERIGPARGLAILAIAAGAVLLKL